MFGIVLFGQLRIGKKAELTREEKNRGEKIHYLKIGDMIGHQNLAEQSGSFMEEKWRYDVYADSDGIIAVMPFGEVKVEMRRNPKAVSVYCL